MRTTINLTDEAYEYARSLAYRHRKSLGEVVSELVLWRSKEKTALVEDADTGLLVAFSGVSLTVDEAKALVEDE